jgi:hypothetical protein
LAINRLIRGFIVVTSVQVPTDDSDATRPAASSIENPEAGSSLKRHNKSSGVGV